MTSHWYLKGIAVLLALLIWVYVSSGDKQTDKLLTIPLTVEGIPEGLAIATGLPDQVELYIRAPQSRVKKVEKAEEEGFLTARLDLRRAVEGKKEYRIRITGVNLRWMFYKVIPGPKLEIECETSSQQFFTPQRVIFGKVDPGTFIELESGLPEAVTVSGAASLVLKVTTVTYRLNALSLVGTNSFDVDFIPQDQNGRQIPNLDLTPPSAELLITIRKASASREVPAVYNLIGSPPSGYTVTDVKIEPLFINLEGSSEMLKDISRIETVAIDLTGHTKDFTVPDLELISPNEKLKLSRNTVYLEVRIAHKTSQRLFEGLPLNWEGANEQFLHYMSEPRTVNVTVAGPLAEVEKLQREMIVPSVRVNALTEGWHKDRPVSVKILLPLISLVEVKPDTVRLHIQKREEFVLEEEKES